MSTDREAKDTKVIFKLLSRKQTDNAMATILRGSKEPVSLTLVYAHIINKGHRWIHDKLCFVDGDVFVDLTLLNILAAYNYLYQMNL